MGIRGAWTTFRHLFKCINPLELQPTCIGIDMFSLVYTHRVVLDKLLDLLKAWSQQGHQIICIWDGTAPKDKHEIIEQRRDARESAIDSKVELETYLQKFKSELTDCDIAYLNSAISSLTWQGWHLTGQMKRDIQEKLGPAIKHLYAPGEADDVLIKMSREKEIDIILSLDSDLFAMGGQYIWRLLRIRDEWIVEHIEVEKVCDTSQITLSMLQDVCFLAGWDRCHLKAEGSYIPFRVALHNIKKYGNLKAVLDIFPFKEPVDEETFDRLRKIKRESKNRWQDILKERKSQVVFRDILIS